MRKYYSLGIAALCGWALMGLSGCVATGVGVGYGSSYYAPSYAGYYGDYGYDGYPYWGAGPYVGSTIVIAGRSHRPYWGGHHYAHDWRATRTGRFHRAAGFRAGQRWRGR
jgi:hypothetical protein